MDPAALLRLDDPARPPMSAYRFFAWVVALALFVPTLLLLDRREISVQFGLGLATALFLVGFMARSSVSWKQIGIALAIATAGEIFFSLIWGCYEYRLGTVPPYVPFGHGIFYALACETGRRKLLLRFEKAVVRAVLVCGWVYAAFSLVLLRDVWGLLWWCGAAILVYISPSPLILASCLVYTILLEWLGTSLGNWRWADAVPFLGIPSANPPSGVGLGYGMLDFSTILLCACLRKTPAPEPAASS